MKKSNEIKLYSEDKRLEFQESTHTYWLDGIKIPSVTRLVKCEYPDTYSRVRPDILEKARDRGNEVHRIIELYEEFGFIDEDSDMYPRLQEYIKLKDMFKFTVEESEMLVYYEKGMYKFAGTIDTVGMVKDLAMLGDVKSYNKSIPMKETSPDYIRLLLQLTGYAMAYEHTTGRKIDILKLIHLPNGKGKFLTIKRDDEFFLDRLEEHYPAMLDMLK